MLQGDVALVRRGAPHTLTSTPRAVAVPLDRFLARHAVATGLRCFELPGAGPTTELLCGAYTFEGSICDSLLDALPAVVLIPARSGTLRDVVAMLGHEVARDAAGQQTVLDRLLDLGLVFALRAHFSAAGEGAPAWYQALDDPVAGPALRALHDEPSRPWTVESLAAEAAMSRAAFARRFKAATGEAPLGYLSRWRMSIAADALRRPGASISAVAREVGYSSEFAFAAAFKRHHGEPPGRFRSRAT